MLSTQSTSKDGVWGVSGQALSPFPLARDPRASPVHQSHAPHDITEAPATQAIVQKASVSSTPKLPHESFSSDSAQACLGLIYNLPFVLNQLVRKICV